MIVVYLLTLCRVAVLHTKCHRLFGQEGIREKHLKEVVEEMRKFKDDGKSYIQCLIASSSKRRQLQLQAPPCLDTFNTIFVADPWRDRPGG